MTAVIAIVGPDGTGAMAADSGMTGFVNMRSRPKIRRFCGALIASSGALSGGQFLDEFASASRAAMLDGQGLLVAGLRILAKSWKTWCVEEGHTEQRDGLRCYPSHFLILTREGLFEICQDGGLLHHPPETRAAAIGNGATVCMGAAWLAEHLGDLTPPEVASLSVRASIDMCDGCLGPVRVEVLEPPPPPELDPQLGVNVLKLIAARDIDRAIKLCNGEINRLGEAPLAAAYRALLFAARLGAEAIGAAFHAGEQGNADQIEALRRVRDALLERTSGGDDG